MKLEVLTKDGLTYYHNKIKNAFVKQSDLDTAIANKLDTIDWVTEIGDAYVTPEQVSDIISQADLDGYMPKTGGTFTGTVNGVTPTSGDNSTKLATTAYVQGELSGATPTSIADTEIEQYWTGVTPEQVNQFLPLSGGTMTGEIRNNWNYGSIIRNSDPNSNGGISISGGYGEANGGQIVLVGEGNSSNPSAVVIRARNSNGYKELFAGVNGTLTWDGKNVERVNVIGTNYIRYESGLQICWGNTQNITSSGTYTINFPVAFSTATDLITTIGRWWVASSTENYYLHDTTTTTIKLTTIGSVGSGGHQYHYIAIGRWK